MTLGVPTRTPAIFSALTPSADRLRKEYGADIITYVGTSALQFINGDLDVNDDAVWNDYVAKIESMNIGELTEIIQTAYDRANG